MTSSLVAVLAQRLVRSDLPGLQSLSDGTAVTPDGETIPSYRRRRVRALLQYRVSRPPRHL